MDRRLREPRREQGGGPGANQTYAARLAGAVVGAALAVLLIIGGGKPDVGLGKGISVTLKAKELAPFGVLEALAGGELPAQEWQRTCAELGIAGADLGKLEVPSRV